LGSQLNTHLGDHCHLFRRLHQESIAALLCCESDPGRSGVLEEEKPISKMVIGIGPVKGVDYLDQSRLVTRTSDNQVVKLSTRAGAALFLETKP
jgi:uncharacterized lipoprotein YmbA